MKRKIIIENERKLKEKIRLKGHLQVAVFEEITQRVK